MSWLGKEEDERREGVAKSPEFAALVASKMTYREIGAKYGMSRAAVCRYAARLGINKQRQEHGKHNAPVTLDTVDTVPRLAVGDWVMTDYPTSNPNGLTITLKARPAKIVKVHPRYYECVTATGQRVCEPIVGARRAIKGE